MGTRQTIFRWQQTTEREPTCPGIASNRCGGMWKYWSTHRSAARVCATMACAGGGAWSCCSSRQRGRRHWTTAASGWKRATVGSEGEEASLDGDACQHGCVLLVAAWRGVSGCSLAGALTCIWCVGTPGGYTSFMLLLLFLTPNRRPQMISQSCPRFADADLQMSHPVCVLAASISALSCTRGI